ncbi:MAG: OmpA family protein [Pseudomonadota bacterium]
MLNRPIALVAIAALTLSACTTDPVTGQPKVSNTAGGAVIGAAVGAAAGTLAGGDDRRNALIGAGIGALAGGGIGAYMDRQEAELRQQLAATGVSVTRVGNNIVLNMPSNITFPVNGDQIEASFVPTLNSVGIVLRRFNQTLVNISGHTDSTGDDASNLALSQRRAQSVSSYLAAQGINSQRFFTVGFGEQRPIADNGSEAGRAQNRRVEIELVPLT